MTTMLALMTLVPPQLAAFLQTFQLLAMMVTRAQSTLVPPQSDVPAAPWIAALEMVASLVLARTVFVSIQLSPTAPNAILQSSLFAQSLTNASPLCARQPTEVAFLPPLSSATIPTHAQMTLVLPRQANVLSKP